MMPGDLDAGAAAVASWLLTYAIHSTLLLAAAAIAAWRFADHHAWLDAIWKTALIAPLVTASVHLQPLSLPLGGRWAMPSVTTVTGGPVVERPSPSLDAAPVPPAIVVERRSSPAGDRVAKDEEAVSTVETPGTAWATVVRRVPLLAAAAWLIFAGAALLQYGLRLRRVHRSLTTGSPVAAAALLDSLDRLRSQAGERRAIRVTTSALCPVPLALSRGQIVLPPRFLEELDPEQQRAALAHEVAHVLRRDPEWRIAVDVLERVLFFQPLNRFARARLCDSAEFLCDDWAVRHTESPVALARCLSIVASWWRPAETLPAGVSAMARSESAMVRRVTRILDVPARIARPRVFWLAIPVALVAVAAPRVTAALPPLVPPAMAAVLSKAEKIDTATEQRELTRQWTAAEIAEARAQLRVHRFDRSGATLEERWWQALADAGKRGVNEFWLVYTFRTPVHGDDQVLSDTREGMSFSGRLTPQGPPLSDVMNPSAIPLEGGNLAVLLHYRGRRPDSLDRAGYRSVELGFDFGRTPVYWLGDVPESQSFERTRALFEIARDREIQRWLVGLAAMHGNSDVVIPFLTRLVESSRPVEIRQEAAEGFEHHHDPRSIEILLRVARTDTESSVRSEAAEAIGEVQTPQSIPALTELATDSADPEVRREAAEGFSSQPAAQALPAIERLIAATENEDVLSEAIEAIGELGDPTGLPLLVQIANTHPNRVAQQEAVETMGDLDAPEVVDALTRIAREHPVAVIQSEAVETLGDRREDAGAMAAIERIASEHDREEVQAEAIETLGDSDTSLHPLLLSLAISGKSPRIRSEALDAIGDAVGKISDAQLLDRAQAAVERVIFGDAELSVRVDAIDALDEFPDERALRALRDIIARHPDTKVRREAEERLRERQ
jgi:HEAT repeat protein/beta-lactamase regulating signal transducer with metallopeptidase domain